MEIAGYCDLVEVGRGAFATVFRARQEALGRDVALKVLTGRSLDADARRRFDRECKAVAALGWHPHVLPVYEAGQSADGHPFLAMELISQGSLADRLRRDGPIGEQDALTLVLQVADALAAAHAAGVVHRDIKPGNVLIGRFGEAKLADFGIAMVGESTSMSGESLSGTLGFMAPELLDGQPATPSTDIYALAASLHLMTTGQAAFSLSRDETPMSLLNRIVREPVPDPMLLGVSSGVANLISRAMAKDRAARFPSAEAFMDAAERAMVRSGWELPPTYTPRSETEESMSTQTATDTPLAGPVEPGAIPVDPTPAPDPPTGAPPSSTGGPPFATRRPILPTPSLHPPEPSFRSYIRRELPSGSPPSPPTSIDRRPGTTASGPTTEVSRSVEPPGATSDGTSPPVLRATIGRPRPVESAPPTSSTAANTAPLGHTPPPPPPVGVAALAKPAPPFTAPMRVPTATVRRPDPPEKSSTATTPRTSGADPLPGSATTIPDEPAVHASRTDTPETRTWLWVVAALIVAGAILLIISAANSSP